MKKTPKGFVECYGHFKNRWKQRVYSRYPDMGLMDETLFQTLRDYVKASVSKGDITVLYKESVSRMHYLVKLYGRDVHIVYNTKLKMPVTVISVAEGTFNPLFYDYEKRL